ncbi:MAG: hypothetical protein ABIK65_09510 [Candidatus Eisenbacteria bacterium]
MKSRAASIAFLSLILGALSWVLASWIPVGLDVAAVVLGMTALRALRGAPKKERIVAWIGFVLGLSKLLVLAGMIVWLAIAFSRNPVAH